MQNCRALRGTRKAGKVNNIIATSQGEQRRAADQWDLTDLLTLKRLYTPMKKLVVFSGAGISAESGISTFRDEGGLWEEVDLEEVATPEAWERNPEKVLQFYNDRRQDIWNAKPNAAHEAIASLDKAFEVSVITQNIDNLHERAGSSKVIHLHGNLFQARSTVDSELVYDLADWQLNPGDRCKHGAQLRPHVVWFDEDVIELETAHELIKACDILIIVGTSLKVYPAAAMIRYASEQSRKFLIDPDNFKLPRMKNLKFIQEAAGTAVPTLAKSLMTEVGLPS